MARFRPEKFPVRVTFGFRNKEERDAWLGQLSDGWGENLTRLEWDYKAGDLHDAKLVGVRLSAEDAEILRHQKRTDRWLAKELGASEAKGAK